MARRAGRRERSRNREQGDLAALEILVRIDRLRSVGGRLDESRLGKLVADLDAHRPFLSLWGMEPTALWQAPKAAPIGGEAMEEPKYLVGQFLLAMPGNRNPPSSASKSRVTTASSAVPTA